MAFQNKLERFLQTTKNVHPEVAEIYQNLLANAEIDSIMLNKCGLDSRAWLHIGQIILYLTDIERITLSGNKIADNGLTYLMIPMARLEFLQLKRLRLNNCGITTEGAEHLANAMTSMPNLEALILSVNYLTDTGVSSIMNALPSGMTQLDLSLTGFASAGAQEIASNLPRFSRIESLQLCNNAMTDEAIIPLSKALWKVPWLRELGLGYNQIENEGAEALWETVLHLVCLENFSIQPIYFSNENEIFLTESLPPFCKLN